MATRLYEVIDNSTGRSRLIEAATPAQARSFVARQAYTVGIPTPMEVAELFATAAVERVEKVTDDAQP